LPKDGWRSITFDDDIYNHYFDKYKKHKKNLKLQGITTFSGYITYLLSKSIGEFSL